MGKLSRSFIIGFSLALISLVPLSAQAAPPTSYQPLPQPTPDSNPISVATTSPSPAIDTSPSVTGTNTSPIDTNAASASLGQAPDDVIKKLSDLVHDGKYAEAQQLAAGLLLAYPDDQRLIKAKTLLDKLLAASNSSQPTNSVAQPAASGTSEQLTGMDKVEYNSLIELGREAQQTPDLDQQKTLLHRFMDESKPFLEKHPNDILLWQLRAVSAITLDDPITGYEAGQKLLASGIADNDPVTQRVLSQLNLKVWLDKQKAESEELQKKIGWLSGTFDVSWDFGGYKSNRDKEEFSISNSIIEGYVIGDNGAKSEEPDLRGTILKSGEINWECYLPPFDSDGLYFFRFIRDDTVAIIGRMSDSNGYFARRSKNLQFHSADPIGRARGGGWVAEVIGGFRYGSYMKSEFFTSGWQKVNSVEMDKDKGIINVVIPSQSSDSKSEIPSKYPVTLIFTKGDSQNQQAPQPPPAEARAKP